MVTRIDGQKININITEQNAQILNGNNNGSANNCVWETYRNANNNVPSNTTETSDVRYASVSMSGTEAIDDDVIKEERDIVDNKPQKYCIDNDKTYKKYQKELSELDVKMKVIEEKYNVTRGVLRTELNIPMDSQDSDDYSKLRMQYKRYQPMLTKYVKEMENWKDGSLGKESFYKRGTVMFTNLERITLKDGQRAWRCNEGVFYPFVDGTIGGPRVQDESLIP